MEGVESSRTSHFGMGHLQSLDEFKFMQRKSGYGTYHYRYYHCCHYYYILLYIIYHYMLYLMLLLLLLIIVIIYINLDK